MQYIISLRDIQGNSYGEFDSQVEISRAYDINYHKIEWAIKNLRPILIDGKKIYWYKVIKNGKNAI